MKQEIDGDAENLCPPILKCNQNLNSTCASYLRHRKCNPNDYGSLTTMEYSRHLTPNPCNAYWKTQCNVTSYEKLAWQSPLDRVDP